MTLSSPARRLLSVFAAVFSALGSAAEPQPGAPEPKTHTLFMGVDFSIEQNKELYRVQDVVGGAFVINVKGKEIRVPMNWGSIRMKVDPSLKLTESSATVTDLKGERAYTLGNDPTVKFQRGLAQSELQYADAQYAQNQALDIQQNVASKQINTQGMDAQNAARSSAAQNAAKAQQLSSATNVLNTANAGPGTTFLDKGNPLATEGSFDAMDVTFAVSSRKTLNHPYVVIVVQYRVTDGKPGQVGNWIYAQALDPIGREPRKIHVEQGGFPPGFELQDFQVHLYNRGEEIATTVAPKRVTLTREEAFQYVLVEYVSSHKGATLPPSPVMGKVPADLPLKLANGELKETYYIKVGTDGKASELFSDKSCSQKVDDSYLESVVKNLRFNPALANGKPVEGVAAVKLAKLPI